MITMCNVSVINFIGYLVASLMFGVVIGLAIADDIVYGSFRKNKKG